MIKFFPILVVAVFVYAGIGSMYRGNWNDAVYSFLAAALNFVVYFKPF